MPDKIISLSSLPTLLATDPRCREVQTTDDDRIFIKTYSGSKAKNQCRAEALGLKKLQRAIVTMAFDHLKVLTPLAQGQNWLALPFIEQSSREKSNWYALGAGLACLHNIEQHHFGFYSDNFCGSTPQPNCVTNNGYDFFVENRLLHQARLNRSCGNLQKYETQQIETLCQKLPDLIPKQPPVFLHGDLWSGNVLFDREGIPSLIDPACYFGWHETDIAMTLLFGGFNQDFYRAYQEHHPMEPGWQDRADLYNLYHLLNHLLIFGSGYYTQVKEILKRFV